MSKAGAIWQMEHTVHLHAHKGCGNQFACGKYKIFVRAAVLIVFFFLFPADDSYSLLFVYLYMYKGK
jgi:hypothetical protein